jgi:hypothetical protein
MQTTEANAFLKRGKGKLKGTVKKVEFYKYYKQNAKEKIVDNKIYNAFIKEVLCSFSELMVTTGLEIRIHKVGKFRIRSNKLKFFKEDGTFRNKLKPNWQATWEYWSKKYPGLTKDEIIKIKNKTVVFHDNDHTQNEFYDHYWDKLTTNLRYKSFYDFKPSRQYSRLIAKVVKDPNRKTFYYG